MDERILATQTGEVVLDSRTIELGRHFGDEVALPKLLVLVEDDDDKQFWHAVFSSCVGDRYSSVDVWPLRDAANNGYDQVDSSGATLTATGKDALMKVRGLGKSKMIAVDADYDLFVDDNHTYTERLRSEKYVQYTTYHSIENHLLDNPLFLSLTELYTLCNHVEPYIYGIVGEMLLHVQKQHNAQPHTHAITVDLLRSALGSLQFAPSTLETDIQNSLIKGIGNLHPSTLQMYNDAAHLCAIHGYGLHNIWQIVQGHTLYEYLEKVMSYTMLKDRKEHEADIRNNSTISGEEKGQRIVELKRQMLGDAAKEEDRFRSDVYSCMYLDMNSWGVHDIQQRICHSLV